MTTTPTPPTVAHDPLSGYQLTTVSVRQDRAVFDLPGRIVAPGLALVPSLKANERDRYDLTHLGSGLKLPGACGRCGTHIEQAAADVLAAGIDWTRTRDVLVADDRVKTLAQDLRAKLSTCDRRCDPIPEGAGWRARCNTCGWEFDEDAFDWPAGFKQARRVARDHECEPEISLSPPGSDRWADEWSFGEDGTPPKWLTQTSRATTVQH